MTMVKRNSIGDLVCFDDLFDIFNNVLSKDKAVRTQIYKYVKEDDSKYEIDMELPGVNISELDMECKDGVISITVNQKQDNPSRSFYYQAKKQILIPDDVQDKNIAANLKDGILRIVLPKNKVQKNETRKIKVLGD